MYTKIEHYLKMYTKSLNSSYMIGILLIVFTAFLAAHWLFKPGYFVMHDDLQMMRQLEMEKCFYDGQIPCRWVPDMGFGYGYPLFNFYPPLPYLLGEIFRLLGFSFVNTAKLLFASQFFLSGITMFILANDLWGFWGGILSAVFYIWAPYHSVDVFVRGAMNEAWAFVWFPLIFWSLRRLIITGRNKYLYWLSFSYAALLLTHNIMTMIFTPSLLLWAFYWWWRVKQWPWRNWFLFGKQIMAGVWALALAAFFTLPILWEKQFTHIESMFSGYFDWRAHFVSLNQLFISRFWGWGPSVWGTDDGMSFSLGHFHWVLLAGVMLGGVIMLWKKKLAWQEVALILGGGFLAFFYAFLTHERSVPLWRLIKPLQMAQFPWRLLAGWVFFSSLVIGFLPKMVRRRLFLVLLLISLIIWNWSFFRPAGMGPLTDEEKFSGKAWEFQQTAGIYDYLPLTVPRAPTAAPSKSWQVVNGKASGAVVVKKTNWWLWQGKAARPSRLRFSLFYFPGWRAWLDLKPIRINHDKDLGRIMVDIPAGQHRLDLRFTNTPVRAWSDFISLMAWWALLIMIWREWQPKLQLKP